MSVCVGPPTALMLERARPAMAELERAARRSKPSSAALPRQLFLSCATRELAARAPFGRLHGNFTQGWAVHVFDDEAIEQSIASVGEQMLERFRSFRHPAHRVDLWRYVTLYLRGGVYLDMKTVLVRPLERTFESDSTSPTLFGVIGEHDFMGDRFHNGVLAAPAGHPLFYKLVEQMLGADAHNEPEMYVERHAYLCFCRYMYFRARELYGADPFDRCALSRDRTTASCVALSSAEGGHAVFFREQSRKSSLRSHACQLAGATVLDKYGTCSVAWGRPASNSSTGERALRDRLQLVIRDGLYESALPGGWSCSPNWNQTATKATVVRERKSLQRPGL